MAEGCEDCLRTQLGFLPEVDYPLSTVLEAPEPVYCVDGSPVVTPHKGFAGPLIATLVVTPPTLASSGPLTGEQVDINFTNDTARTITFAFFVSGSILLQNVSNTYIWTFTYGFDLVISSPVVSTAAVRTAQTNYPYTQTIDLGWFGSTSVAPGGSLSVSPKLSYVVTGSGSPGQSVLHGANLSVMMFGGPA